MKSFTALAAVAALVAAPLTFSSSASAVGETCNGLAATMVGTPGSTVTGTEGPDVIVSNGALDVRGNGGDDSICTTGSGAPTEYRLVSVRVLAGTGNDVVDRRGDPDPAAVGLVSGDAGQDTILGAPGADLFNSNDGEHDVVSTGAGNDSGTDGGDPGPFADPDTIDLGPGDDGFSASPPFSSALTVTGGEGVDAIFWTSLPATGGSYTVDATTGQLRDQHGVVTSFSGLEDFSASTRKPASWSFVGSDAAERVLANPPDLSSAVMGGGDDVVLFAPGLARRKISIDGGPGRDRVDLFAGKFTTVNVDLGRGRFAIPNGSRGRLTGFEDADVNGGKVRLTGTDGANTLAATTCYAGRIDAGRGGDTVSIARRPQPRCNLGTTPEVYGGAGSDSLKGSRVGDLLVGGPGVDTANGVGGVDICRSVEARTRCERR